MKDLGSIPTGKLPDGWVRADGSLTFRYPTARLSACAVRRPTDGAPDAFGLGTVWAILCTRLVGEATEGRTVETAATRRDAVEGLCVCMERIAEWAGPVDATVPLSAFAGGPNGGPPSDDSTVDADAVDTTSYAESWATRLD